MPTQMTIETWKAYEKTWAAYFEAKLASDGALAASVDAWRAEQDPRCTHRQDARRIADEAWATSLKANRGYVKAWMTYEEATRAEGAQE